MKQFNKITTGLLCSSLLTSFSYGSKYGKYKINSTASDFSFGSRFQPNSPTQRMESTPPQSPKPYSHKKKKGRKKIERATSGRSPYHNQFYDYDNDGLAKGEQTPVIKLGSKYSPPNSQSDSPSGSPSTENLTSPHSTGYSTSDNANTSDVSGSSSFEKLAVSPSSSKEKFGNELQQDVVWVHNLPLFKDWIMPTLQKLYQSSMGIQLLKECELSSKTVAERLNNPPKSTQRAEVLAWVRRVCEDCEGLCANAIQKGSENNTLALYWILNVEEWEKVKELLVKGDPASLERMEQGKAVQNELQQQVQQMRPSAFLQEQLRELREALRATLLRRDATKGQEEYTKLETSFLQLLNHFRQVASLIKNYSDLLEAGQKLTDQYGAIMRYPHIRNEEPVPIPYKSQEIILRENSQDDSQELLLEENSHEEEEEDDLDDSE